MKTIKNIFKLLGLLVLVVLLAAGFILYPLLRGATGYSAKMLCSGIFVEGLSQKQVEQMELNTFPFDRVDSFVDREEKRVKSSIFGLISQVAVFEEGIGATLYPKGYSKINGREACPKVDNAALAWPMGSVLNDSIPSGVDLKGLNAYINQNFNAYSRAVLVVQNGQLITEKYADGLYEYTPLLGWSMTKTITGTLTGMLYKEGKLDIHQPVNIKNWQGDERKMITLNNLLQMSSGLQWSEDYSKTALSNVSEMLYIKGDMYKYAASPKLAVSPDSVWQYSSGTTNIISGLLRSSFHDYESYYQFPQKALFNKLGMSHSLIETDATGTFVGSSYGYCSARDWARLGMLYLNNGKWLGEQILPEDWVSYCTTPARQSNGKYGVQMWLNHSQIHMPDMPAEVYFFNGYRGQRVCIIPSMQMVIVCLNSSPERIDFNTYLSGMMKFFEPSS